ncbi:Las1-like family protein [Spironucleus salmonicida]|uniref:Las1-like family protein n=1 Tax=Spironucleus salmonicida TaxID=348837 RepID=V6LFK4_9EUKA|nr:Las1-like family protein [Spironucleus salmonicida]|eukprot:EST42486.1 Las1-like family protein [Spironucleus salmonicida]
MNLPELTFPASLEVITKLQLISLTNHLPPIYESYFNISFALQQTSKHIKQQLLGAAIMRFCNSFLEDYNSEGKKIDLKIAAHKRHISTVVTDVRNAFSHTQIPKYGIILKAANEVLKYLQKVYTPQKLSNYNLLQNKLNQFLNANTISVSQEILNLIVDNELHNKYCLQVIFCGFFYRNPEIAYKTMRSSDNFLSNDPMSGLKRVIQYVRKTIELPIFDFILGQTLNFENIQKDPRIEFSQEFAEAMKIEIIGEIENVQNSGLQMKESHGTTSESIKLKWFYGVSV